MSTRSDQRKDAAEHGLYDPAYEHDACGVGFVASVKGQASHEIVTQALQILKNLDHRGAVGADPLCGDGAGILIQIADALRGRPLPRCGSIRSASTPIDSKNFLSAIGQPRFTQDISLSPKTLSGPRSKRSL